MPSVTRDILLQKALTLWEAGQVDAVLGWQKGEFCYDVTPALFTKVGDLKEKFVYNDFCGANFSKYLIGAVRESKKAILVFLKPCDTYSFNQLLTEHRFPREKIYAVGIPCGGMLDPAKVREGSEGLLSAAVEGEDVILHTLYEDRTVKKRADCLAERCLNCKSKKHAAFDELLEGNSSSDGASAAGANRFAGVEALEAMDPDERFAFWQKELSRCIRCNACRDVCPACTCETCVFDNPKSGVANKAAADSFEEKAFHIIRAFHVAGRCTDCGECSRVCPQHIPLHLLNRKFIKDINGLYGPYQAGETVGSRSPLVDFTWEDPEPDVVRKGDKSHA